MGDLPDFGEQARAFAATAVGIRGGKIRSVDVTTARTIAHPKRLRSYLRAAGLR